MGSIRWKKVLESLKSIIAASFQILYQTDVYTYIYTRYSPRWLEIIINLKAVSAPIFYDNSYAINMNLHIIRSPIIYVTPVINTKGSILNLSYKISYGIIGF